MQTNILNTAQRLGGAAAGLAVVLGGLALAAAPASAAEGANVSPQVAGISVVNGPLVEGPLVDSSLADLVLGPFNFGQFQ